MYGHGIESRAATAVRTYEGRLLRAHKEHEEARKALEQSAIDLHKAEAAYEAAKHVYQAADADRIRDLGLDKIGALTLAWIKELSAYPHAGTAELQLAANAAGWNATPAAIRQQAKRLTEKGVLTKVNEGVYRVSERVLDLLKDQPEPDRIGADGVDVEDVSGLGPTSERLGIDTLPLDRDADDVAIVGDSVSQAGHGPQEQSDPDDDYDNDPAF